MKRRKNRLVRLALVGTPLFFWGCGGADTVLVERRVADGVDIRVSAGPNLWYSPYYGGYVPIYVPVTGYVGPRYYSGGYRAPRTVVNNYYQTHPTTAVRPPAPKAAPAQARPTPNLRSGAASGGAVKSGGFGAIGRGGAGVSA